MAKIKNPKILFFIIMFGLAALSACRYEVGYDYDNFRRVFIAYTSGSPTYTETGYEAYMSIIYFFFGTNIVILYAVEAFFTVFAFVYFIRKNVKREYWIYAAALFVTTDIFFSSMNLSRQYVAIGFVLISFEAFKEKKYFICFLWCLVALSFHSSSCVIMVFYVFLYVFEKSKRKTHFFAVVNMFVILSIILGMIDIRNLFMRVVHLMYYVPFLARFTWYVGNSAFLSRNETAYLKYMIPTLIWFYVYYFKLRKIRESHPYADYYLMMFSLYLIISNSFYGITTFVRLGLYFEVAVLPLIPLVIQVQTGKNRRLWAKLFFLAYYLAVIVKIVFISDSYAVIPYQAFFMAS